MLKKIALFLILTTLVSCQRPDKNQKLQVVTTTTILTDLVKTIGGDSLQVEGLMGAGVDPHLYKAGEGDVSKLFVADVVFYGGLHLEGKLVDVFERMHETGKLAFAVSDTLDESVLIHSENFASSHDPHIWFDVANWKKVSGFVAQKLISLDPENAQYYQTNLQAYLVELDSLDRYIRKKTEELPPEKRILVTAHDAFNYFGKAYGFEVVALQGLSTATEAGVKDVQNLTGFIVDKRIKAIFVESSVPRRTIDALREAVIARGHDVRIGGSLYSDALGNPGTAEGTYTGMFTYNINTIVNALK